MNHGNGCRDFFLLLTTRKVDVMNTVGERIKFLRKLRKYSQVEFAEAIGISQGTLSDIENDRTKPSIDTVISIHMAFNCSFNWLLLNRSQDTRTDNPEFVLSLREIDMIQNYRELESVDQNEINEIIKIKRRLKKLL